MILIGKHYFVFLLDML